MFEPTWSPPPSLLRLAKCDVHLWRIDLLQPAPVLEQMRYLLGEEEGARAGRFYFSADRESFIVAHGAMRSILANYVRLPPEQLRFETGPAGKPRLADQKRGLEFNLSHSGTMALLAVSRENPLGVDLERVRSIAQDALIAARFFSAAEQVELAADDEGESAAFFRIWTRKEALSKADGRGLTLLAEPSEAGPADLSNPSPPWRTFSFCPAASYIAALVTKRPIDSLHYWIFES